MGRVMQGRDEAPDDAGHEPTDGPARVDGADDDNTSALHLTRDWRPAGADSSPAARVLGLFDGQLPDKWEGEPIILAITSGKGGVGKSNIAASLSLLLAAVGTRVALIDGDLGVGNLDVLIGIEARASLADVLSGRRQLSEVMTRLSWGVDFAGGDATLSGIRLLDPMKRLRLLDQVAELRGTYDLIILDCGAGLGGEVLDFCNVADRVFLVTTPEPTALTAGYGLLKAIAGKRGLAKVGVVVNRATDADDAASAFQRINSVAQNFLGEPVQDAGFVVEDLMVRQAVRKRKPFLQVYPRCQASRCIAALAAKILPRRAEDTPEEHGGLLSRILGYLE